MKMKNPKSPIRHTRQRFKFACQRFRKRRGIFALATCVLPHHHAKAAVTPPTVSLHTAKLAWNPVPQLDIQGYRVYVGTQSHQYTQTLNVGKVTTYPVNSLEFGKTYYFTVSAIGSTGLEGSSSTELVVTIAPPPLPVGGRISLNGSGKRDLQWTFPKSALGSSPEFIVYASPDLVNWSKFDTVTLAQSTGSDSQSLEFSWPVVITGPKMFFRITARNWMGEATKQ